MARRKKNIAPIWKALHIILKLLFIMIAILIIMIVMKVMPRFMEMRQQTLAAFDNMQESDFRKMSDTEIYDKDGNRVGVINAGHYEYVSYDDISSNIIKAYVDQEDRKFWEHGGVDLLAIVRAGLSYIKHKGKITQGGSTITQQVIKNTYLTREKTFTRKLSEFFLAPELEKKFGKEKIIEFYCNENFYGHGCYGVQSACRYYFDKDASDVDIWEAALLVGISNRPSAYDPIKNPEDAILKRNEVLSSMYACGDITEDELKEYTDKPLGIITEHDSNSNIENYMTSYAIHCAALIMMEDDGFEFRYIYDNKDEYEMYKQEFADAYAEKSDEIRGGGFKIYTTLDSDIQAIAQRYLDEMLEKKDELQDNGKYAMQGAVAIVDNRTNNVVAIVGGRGTEDEFNRAYLSARQPGSSIKPLLDYTPALDKGLITPGSIINDHQWEDGPKNSGNSYSGNVTITEAVTRSLNTVAWQVLELVGIKDGLKYLADMEFRTINYADESAPSVSIGGFTDGVRVVDMAKGYSTLANYGTFSDKTCISSILSDKAGGADIYSGIEDKKQVYNEGAAWQMTEILKNVIKSGTGRGLDISGQEAAGKTGTTNASKDTWFCGYTRYYSTAVWVGYDTPRAMPGIYGATYAGKIWKNIMTELHKDLEKWDWEKPANMQEIEDIYYGVDDEDESESETDPPPAETTTSTKEPIINEPGRSYKETEEMHGPGYDPNTSYETVAPIQNDMQAKDAPTSSGEELVMPMQ